MKTTLLAAAAASVVLAPLAFADSMSIISVTEGVQPVKKATSTAYYDFNPGRNKIVFKVMGKTCTLNSSGNPYGSGTAGCNYTVTINNSTMAVLLTSNGKGCTTMADFAASCK